MINMPN